ncbi:sigma-54 interaction domain-containing protein [Nitratidesulfovibrio vulgaris]|uniref:Sigma-54 dependent transcriptional regulator n=1 Tax=Nitratidesulfovibrio vulgaris (strain ATCC 29579 / DSM 644 / CCUG 34227 / NCIMB 8303 / VKM B-1760 / Hildenborough) TaxID=882 RepID=Q72WI9_NITV2|nr:sigma-54-dependent Fis family transcriptional regulator [Nitratidesulfovibrio vulgaris]AAS94360.1 sigma-54 dependent transcriptional regulator [Nitratidesulfovibrio vulgaris str. Hildenborough]ADP88337.1 sigma54 specific transcriptional regulator, Fis family [Nitratidesulfovibrio vulgaris RCH1]
MDENDLLDNLIDLCDDLAWGRPASEDRLFGLTAPQASFQISGQTPCQTPGQASSKASGQTSVQTSSQTPSQASAQTSGQGAQQPSPQSSPQTSPKPGAGTVPERYTRLAEAFGMMLVKVEAREFQQAQLIAELRDRNEELEEARRLLTERNQRLAHTLQDSFQPRRLIGQCAAMRAVTDMALSIARRPINTLLLGPTGAGKEVVAKLIHYSSPRREGPFIAVNCTAIPEALFESEMFGIERGVATGVSARKGLVEEADGGTLFLDELADMPLPHQAKLLRVLEGREVVRVGSSRAIPVDIKVVAATNADLAQAVREGRFREDLYYRINVAEVHLPPLCERGDDILLLAQHFLERHCAQMGRPRLTISFGARDLLRRYAWPGNVRELNNEMERAAALTIGDRVEVGDLSPRIAGPVGAGGSGGGAGGGTAAASAGRETASAGSAGHAPGLTAGAEGSGGAAGAGGAPCPAGSLPGAGSLPDAGAFPGAGYQPPSVASPSPAFVAAVSAGAGQPGISGGADAADRFNLHGLERETILAALDHAGGNKSRAAELLGITREGLRKKLLRFAISGGDDRA